VTFSDVRLASTPVYSDLVNRYLERIISQSPAPLAEGIDFLIQQSSGTALAREYMITYLLGKYMSKLNIPLSEYAFLHIVETYIFESGADWISNTEVQSLTREYNRRKPASLMETAPEISWRINGADSGLSSITSEFVVLYFYSSDCPLCTKTTPELRRVVSKFDYLSIRVLAVNTEINELEWKNYIAKNKITSWVNTSVQYLLGDGISRYNLSLIPTLFLLDKNKTIIRKNMTTAQLNDFFLRVALAEAKQERRN
jgi:thiol-disulfide isomerase/thioredoxin